MNKRIEYKWAVVLIVNGEPDPDFSRAEFIGIENAISFSNAWVGTRVALARIYRDGFRDYAILGEDNLLGRTFFNNAKWSPPVRFQREIDRYFKQTKNNTREKELS